ncbi:hypothetical protein L1276_000015 [Flavobacterium sp. HSC-32F16]|uniref:hypothetical protein n=1 Tax=Flavobacterium sp. HSC-32F16 TaxID=2910964 RepID=UPI0020A35468|nr:hypothetical protein [Flavobacterium sp. HSC-32F16]MCP2024875.1 hypothetical protein [Flavobacterium sp. HSC-32F16]
MKKLKSLALVTLFVSTSLFTSCSSDSGSDDQTPEASQGDYWPAAVGNQWVLNQSGAETSMKIISSEKVGADTYFKFDKLFISSSDVVAGSASASIKKVQGDYFIKLDEINISANGFAGKISGYEFVFFKDYLDVNKTWTGSYVQETTYTGIATIKSTTKYTGTIVEKGATATIKNVTYKDVIKFKLKLETSIEGQSAGSTEAEYWIAKGVGIIKFGFNNAYSELVSYKVN